MKILTSTELKTKTGTLKGVNSPSGLSDATNISEVYEKQGKFIYKTADGEKEIKADGGLKKVVVALSTEDWFVTEDGKATYTITPAMLTLPPSVTYTIEMQVFNYKIMVWERVAVTPKIDQEGNIIITVLQPVICNVIITSGLTLPPPKPVPPKIYGVDQIGRQDAHNLPRTGAILEAEHHFVEEVFNSICISTFDNVYPYSEMKVIQDTKENWFVRIPKFYHKYTLNNNGTLKLEICNTKVDDTWNTLFVNGDEELPYVDIGCYWGGNENYDLVSKPGNTNYNNNDIERYRNYARAHGIGYHIMDMYDLQILQILFVVEFATTDCQSIFYGNDRNGYYNPGDCTQIIRFSTTTSGINGTNAAGHTSFAYRGVENLWGNLYTILDGAYYKQGNLYVCNDITKYNNSDFSTYRFLGKPNTSPSNKSGGLQKLKLSNDKIFAIPDAAAGVTPGSNFSTYISDMIQIPPEQDTTNIIMVDMTSGSMGWQGLWAYYMHGDFATRGENKGVRLCRKPITGTNFN